jgi:hypothetical protein
MDSSGDGGRALVRTLSMAEAAGRTMGKMQAGLPTLTEQQSAAKGASHLHTTSHAPSQAQPQPATYVGYAFV